MNFNTVDLQAELEKIKRKSKVDILDEVQDILNHEIEKEAIITEKIQGKQEGQPNIDWSKLNPQNIYNLEQIKKICVKYRLRFL
ncbi:MAG: hypothetical protein ACJAQ2_002293, partial [Vicingaceae bacterium]